MTCIGTLQSKTGEALVAAARSSQALVIATWDRAAGGREPKALPLLNRVGRLQLELASLLLDDPAEFFDEGYGLLQRLTSLHREFTQRLFEVLDPRDPPLLDTSDAATGHVLPFPTRQASTS